MLELTLWRHGCSRGSEPVSPCQGPRSQMTPVCSSSRYSLWSTSSVCSVAFLIICLSGLSREGQKTQGALCLPWERHEEDGGPAVLHSPPAGVGQSRVSQTSDHASRWCKVRRGETFCRLEPHVYLNRFMDVQKELDEMRSKSATTLLATEDEILQLKAE